MEEQKTYRCLACKDMGYVYLPVSAISSQFGKAYPCLECATVSGGRLYRDTVQGKLLLDQLESMR